MSETARNEEQRPGVRGRVGVVVRGCGVVVAGLGLLALAGWLAGVPVLAALAPDLMPMAPDTAVLFVLAGSGLVLADGLLEGRVRMVGLWVAGTATAGAVVLSILSLFGVAWGEPVSAAASRVASGAPAGRMPALPAVLFVVFGTAFVLRLRERGGTRGGVKAAFFVAMAATFVPLLLTSIYVVGGPLLHGAGVIPEALTTSLAFLFLGTGLMTWLWPWRGEGRYQRRLVQGAAAGVVLVVVFAAVRFRAYQERFRGEFGRELAATVELKVEQLDYWRRERLRDARAFFDNDELRSLVRRVLADPGDADAARRLRLWLVPIRDGFNYQRISLVDRAGVERLGVPVGARPDERSAPEAVAFMNSGVLGLADFHRHSPTGRVHLSVVAPIPGAAADTVVGALALWVDPSTYINGVLRRWPAMRETGETVLVRRDGADAAVLNTVRSRESGAPRTRIPLTEVNHPAVMAVSGRRGVVEGVDEAGAPVIAAIRPVPGSDWHVVAQVDAQEVLAPVRQHLWWFAGLVGALVFGGLALTGLLWQWSEKTYFRRLAEIQAARRRSETRHSITLDSIGDAVITTDAEGRVELLNPVAEALTGWREKAARGRPLAKVFRVVDEETGEPVENPATRILRDGVVTGLGERTLLVARDGTERPVADSGAPIRDDDGRVTGVVLVFRDQTQEREARRRLEAEVERSERYLHVAGVMIVVLDRDGTVEVINERGCEILGYPEQEIVGKNWFEHFLPESERVRVKGIQEQALDGDLAHAETAENAVLTRSGEERIIAWKNALVRDADGTVIRTVSSGEDITERRRAEEELRRSERRYRLLFEEAPVGIFRTSYEGKALSANAAMARILGFETGEEAVAHYDDLAAELYVDPGRREEFLRLLREHGEVQGFVYEARTYDGRTIWLQMDARVAGSQEDGAVTIEGFAWDITGRVEAERKEAQLRAELVQAQKMESVGRLAGGVAHDFNNMLAVILGHAELAMEVVKPGEPLHHDLREIRTAAERSARLTGQLLAFARKQTISPQVLNINETVQGMLTMLRRIIGEDIDLAWLPCAEPWLVHMDSAQIDQVLANLVVNARDAIDGVGKVTIETRNVTVTTEVAALHPDAAPGDYLQLAVSDTGSGMDEAALDQVFDPFYTTKPHGQGTGLGLAMVYGIARQNAGFINVYSEIGQGTTFKIYLPRYEGAEPAAAADADGEALHGGEETVMVVEDEAAVLQLTVRMLERLGYHVLSATGAPEALRVVAEHDGEIDLLLTDVVMPEMNGRELAARIRAEHPDIRTVFMSGYTANAIAHRGILEEGVRLLQKPFSTGELAAELREALDQA